MKNIISLALLVIFACQNLTIYGGFAGTLGLMWRVWAVFHIKDIAK